MGLTYRECLSENNSSKHLILYNENEAPELKQSLPALLYRLFLGHLIPYHVFVLYFIGNFSMVIANRCLWLGKCPKPVNVNQISLEKKPWAVSKLLSHSLLPSKAFQKQLRKVTELCTVPSGACSQRKGPDISVGAVDRVRFKSRAG